MKPAIIEDKIFEFEPFEENGSVLMAAETSWRGMADELQELHYLKGAKFINQLKLIIYYGEYHLVVPLIPQNVVLLHALITHKGLSVL